MQNTKDSHEFFHSILTNLPYGVIMIDENGIVKLINSIALQFLGLEGSTTLYEDTYILSFLSNSNLKNQIRTSLLEEDPKFHLKAQNIMNRYFNIRAHKILNGLVINILDVTENIIMRDKATQSLILGQEKERKRIASEIHDGIGPALSVIRLHIESVNKKIDNPDIKKKLNAIHDHLLEVSTEIRQISHELMPSSLLDFGIVSALNQLINRINESEKLIVLLDCNINDDTLPNNLELNIYRIVQELLNNAIKYAQCREVQIQLYKLENEIQLSVYDDGIGMDVTKLRNGIGIENIQTRVKSFRGNFEFHSQIGHGVNANISIPLKVIS